MKATTHTLIERGPYKIVFVEALSKYAIIKNEKAISFYDSIREALDELKQKEMLTNLGKAGESGVLGKAQGIGLQSGPGQRPPDCKLSKTIIKERLGE